MAAINKIHCSACRNPFDGLEAIVQVTKCGHLWHRSCFFSGTHVTKVDNVIQKVICPHPQCGKIIVDQARRNLAGDVNKKIEILEFPQPPAAPPAPPRAPQPLASQTPVEPQRETRGIKYVAYLAAALICITLAGVIYPCWIAFGISAAVAIPLGYLIGRKIEQYHATSV